jgi:DNA-directed RNA polymerase specialized sigma24 family protein
MDQGTPPNENSLDRLLNWLDPDRETAGEKYEILRQKLIRIFVRRGFTYQSEDLADQTIKIVEKKLEEILDDYQGDPALYFYGVARNVFLENKRKPLPQELPPQIPHPRPTDDLPEIEDECLSLCLKNLRPEQSEFIIDYYQGEKAEKINNRKSLAAKLEIPETTLHVRAFRLKETLRKCVLKCVSKKIVKGFS